MLKEFIAFKILSAVVGASFPAFRPRVIDGGLLRVVSAPDLSPPSIDEPEIAPSVTKQVAVAAFMADLMDYVPGESMAFHRVKSSYVQMAPEFGWPPISDKALSRALVEMGCTRRKVDMRATGGGRRSEIVFPETMGDAA